MSSQYTSDYAVAFLDLLGFKSFVEEDRQAALQLLLDIQQIAATAVSDAENHPPSSYDNVELARMAGDNQISSFEVFLPISDSIIILSHDPNLMVRQLSNYLSNCFGLTSHVYAQAKEGTDPSVISFPTSRRVEVDKVDVVDEGRTHWYPKLFRGGLSYGSITRIPSPVYTANKQRDFFNLAGMAYVRATQLEKYEEKGPRLFCAKSFFDQLDERTRRFVVPTRSDGIFEVLWPAFQFNENSDPEMEKHQFVELYKPVKALSHFYAKSRVAKHYHQYEVLLARSTIQYFAVVGREQLGMSLVASNFSKRVIEDIYEKGVRWHVKRLGAKARKFLCGQ
ncbi:hypothetical protein KJZ99_08225 [bacterium]|nr:hypothetical protein [bacterium]